MGDLIDTLNESGADDWLIEHPASHFHIRVVLVVDGQRRAKTFHPTERDEAIQWVQSTT